MGNVAEHYLLMGCWGNAMSKKKMPKKLQYIGLPHTAVCCSRIKPRQHTTGKGLQFLKANFQVYLLLHASSQLSTLSGYALLSRQANTMLRYKDAGNPSQTTDKVHNKQATLPTMACKEQVSPLAQPVFQSCNAAHRDSLAPARKFRGLHGSKEQIC